MERFGHREHFYLGMKHLCEYKGTRSGNTKVGTIANLDSVTADSRHVLVVALTEKGAYLSGLPATEYMHRNRAC
jgi:hypothetical protein